MNRQNLKTQLLKLGRIAYRSLPFSLQFRSTLGPIVLNIAQRVLRINSGVLPADKIQPGNVIVSGFLTNVTGIARAGRMTLDAMQSWEASIVAHDLAKDPAGQSVVVGPGGVWICHCNPPQAIAFMLGSSNQFWHERYRIGIWAYELPRLPRSWRPALRMFHEIWAPSQFVADAILAEKVPGLIVRVVPHPVQVPHGSRPKRDYPNNRRFQFLTMFDARSTFARKNPVGTVEAFQLAFKSDDNAVRLVIKANGVEHQNRELSLLQKKIEEWPNIEMIDDELSDEQTLDLIAASDCLVSLHRSEGFGLVVAEAMSVGTPVIATNWSAPTEFMGEAALPVGFTLVPAVDTSGRYARTGQNWAEPDVEEAARAMKELVGDPKRWRGLSAAGPELARSHLGQWISSDLFRRFLREK